MAAAHAPLWCMKRHGYKGPRQSHGAGFGGFRNAKRFGGGEHEGVRGAKCTGGSPPRRKASDRVPRETPK